MRILYLSDRLSLRGGADRHLLELTVARRQAVRAARLVVLSRYMAEAVATLAADPAMAVALGSAGREVVAERFTQASIEGRLRALYNAAAGFVGSGAAG